MEKRCNYRLLTAMSIRYNVLFTRAHLKKQELNEWLA